MRSGCAIIMTAPAMTPMAMSALIRAARETAGPPGLGAAADDRATGDLVDRCDGDLATRPGAGGRSSA